jgi:hypothetical protein
LLFLKVAHYLAQTKIYYTTCLSNKELKILWGKILVLLENLCALINEKVKKNLPHGLKTIKANTLWSNYILNQKTTYEVNQVAPTYSENAIEYRW